jgi:hypothetical protein
MTVEDLYSMPDDDVRRFARGGSVPSTPRGLPGRFVTS